MRAALGLGRPSSDALVFGTIEGLPLSPDKLSRDWRRTVLALELPAVRFHALRHTHASVLIAEGLDVLTVSRRLGHGSPVVTLNTCTLTFLARRMRRPRVPSKPLCERLENADQLSRCQSGAILGFLVAA